MRYLILFLIAFTSVSSVFSQDRKLRVYLDTKQFFAPGVGHLLEVNLQFEGASLNYKGKDDGLIADVAVYLTLEQNGSIYKEDAHRLESPFMKDSIIEDFYDLKRFVVEPGDYELKIELKDLLSENPSIKGSLPISISEVNDKVTISDIQIAEVANPGNESSLFHKSGFEIIPRISTYYPKELNAIPYYIEIYNTDLLEIPEFGLKQTVIDQETNEEIEELSTFYRFESAKVVPVLKQLDISALPTGTFVLQLSILNPDLSIINTNAYIFDRANDKEIHFDDDITILDPAFEESFPKDSAKYYLGSIIPISTAETSRRVMSLLKSGTKEESLLFLQAFWKATSGAEAYTDWLKYKAQVQLVEKLYATNFQDGYETDRGRVYLQYGSPSNILRRPVSTSEYPYEMWRYDKIGRFSNKRFIFYNTDLIGENYRLLHSDMIGEIKNSNWPHALNSRNSTNGDVDNGNAGVQEHYGGQSEELLRQW